MVYNKSSALKNNFEVFFMIRLKNIFKSYEISKNKVFALKNINLNIAEGEFVSVIGHSGSGKSTLLNIMGFLDTADSGSFYFDGRNVSFLSQSKLSKIRGREIGFVFQSFNLIPSLTAFENVCLPLVYMGMSLKERRKIGEAALKSVGLGDRMKHLPNQLSGGQMQRVAVARALAINPKIILADEPTGNLDADSSREVLFLLKDFVKSGKTVVMVTHDEKIANTTDRIIRITNGEID